MGGNLLVCQAKAVAEFMEDDWVEADRIRPQCFLHHAPRLPFVELNRIFGRAGLPTPRFKCMPY